MNRRLLGLAVVGLLIGSGAAIYSSLPHRELPDDFDFHGKEITAARGAAVIELRDRLDAFESRAKLDHVGARERSDRCSPGQDNFTRQDEYAYVCVLEIAQLVPVAEPFYSNASRLAEALVEGDCPGGTTAEQELAKHLAAPEELNDETDGLLRLHAQWLADPQRLGAGRHDSRQVGARPVPPSFDLRHVGTGPV
jgi:hypothetical protein